MRPRRRFPSIRLSPFSRTTELNWANRKLAAIKWPYPLKIRKCSAQALDTPPSPVAEEVEILRKSFRACLDVYTQRIETELKEIKEAALAQNNGSQVPASKIRDLRDMIILCRTLDIKPDKGRRKDLKKIDSLIDELHLMIENWR